MNMSVKFFGQYLIEQRAIQRTDLLRALGLQEKANLRFGDIVLGMGLMNDEQLARVHEAQRFEDLRFGDMAIRMGFLTPEQVALVLDRQRKNYLYIGEALIKLGSLTLEQLNSYLERYNQEQQHLSGMAIKIPPNMPNREIWEIVVDMHCKMLTRFAGLSYRLGPGILTDRCPQRQITLEAGLVGDINARLLITLSKRTRALLAEKVLNSGSERTYPETIQNDALVRFFNLVCGNIVSKAALLNYEIGMRPSRLHQEHETIKKGKAEIGLLFPIHLPEGDAIEITIFAIEKMKCQA